MNENVKKYGKILAWIVLPTLLIAFIYMVVYMRKKKIGLKQLPKELKKEIKNIDLKNKLGITKKENNLNAILENNNDKELIGDNQKEQNVIEEKLEIEKKPEQKEKVKDDIKD